MLSLSQAIQIAFNHTTQPQLWQSLVINKRQPYTHRAFIQQGDTRICLHRFEPCSPDESFPHPHPWPATMLILSGVYDMAVFHTPDLKSRYPSPVLHLTLSAGSVYQMRDRHTWHQVIPRSECYSLMINGPRWEKPHRFAPTTRGKALKPMSEAALASHLAQFRQLLVAFE
ncbi:MAG: hypothetical protein SAJ12_00500 [Jaaginema sp. PMC 1079.18]|nr:hypothetical protein [Jaaginema sp. PMC 1080.18]MEC4849463.1 hypothetical protein [Jaaginema sp. PMC 1079.18]MEC4865438.1 hypothetical protein [Jaaginema sp. PMC 1078.18]